MCHYGHMMKLENQKNFEQKALDISSLKKRKQFLTNYSMQWGTKVVDEAWKLGDAFWTKYDEKF